MQWKWSFSLAQNLDMPNNFVVLIKQFIWIGQTYIFAMLNIKK